MTRQEALAALDSDSSHTRFLAMRSFERLATSSDVDYLLRLQTVETDIYLKKRIQRLIVLLGAQKPIEIQEDELIAPEVRQRLRAEAIEWVAGLLLHEIGSKLGLLASTVSLEVPSYPNSVTKKRVEQLQGTFDGIEELKKATAVPSPAEMDLAEFIRTLVELETNGKDIEVSLVGRTPMIIFCDRGLLGLALSNGIKNAVEASLSVATETRKALLAVRWEQTDIDTWISVIDNGPGLSSNIARSFTLGESSKAGHLGFGLGIAKQAIETLNGSVELLNSGAGGASYVLRWSLVT